MKNKIPYDVAVDLGERVCKVLAPYCEQIVMAGSIRRQKKVVGDIEIVCQPLPEYDLFGQVGYIDVPIHKLGGNVIMNGERYKRLVVPIDLPFIGTTTMSSSVSCSAPVPYYAHSSSSSTGMPLPSPVPTMSKQDIQLDIFCVRPPATWGVILAIRTGGVDFAKKIVTQRRKGGFLPDKAHVADGAVAEGGDYVGFDSEGDFFKYLGIGWVDPVDRDSFVER